MTSEAKGSVRRGQRVALVALCMGGAVLLAGCAGKHAQADQAQAQQQALERARGLCRDFGYTPGTMEFARCAQSEYDRGAPAASLQAVAPPQVVVPVPQVAPPPAAPPVAASPQAAAPQAAQPQPTPQADNDSDNWLINWLKRPPVCRDTACAAGW
ncbi:MAG: hypothetical protein ACLQJR_28385 [Stellaceae bacterium]